MVVLPLRVGLFSSPKRTSMPYCGLPSTTHSRVRVFMSMQMTRPVLQRGSSAPGVLWPYGTPASQPLPPGFGVLGFVDGFGEGVDGLGFGVELLVLLGALVLLEELDDVELVEGAGELLLTEVEVGVGVGVGLGVVGALVAEFAVDELVSTPAPAWPSESVFVPLDPVPHPDTPIATAPATATNRPPFPAPEVLMPLSTPEEVR